MISTAEELMRAAAHAMPTCDFGSTRAIQAAAKVAETLVIAERIRCADIARAIDSGRGNEKEIVRAIWEPAPAPERQGD